MQRWEHFATVISFDAGVDPLNEWLAQVGQEGWELVSAVPASTFGDVSGKRGYQPVSGGGQTNVTAVTSVLVFLKRPIG